MTDVTRWCPSCREDRPAGAFSPGSTWCKPCMCIQVRRRRAVDYEAELAAQGGVCAICASPPGAKRLAIDHDHRTGHLRGLLCDRCNQLLGKANDSIAMLRRAIDYLEKPGREIAIPPLKQPNRRPTRKTFPVEIRNVADPA